MFKKNLIIRLVENFQLFNLIMFQYENRFMSRSNSISEAKEPYEIIIEKNLRSRAKRAQDDAREELGKVLQRVENVIFILNF